MQTYTARVDWLHLAISLDLDAAIRWAPLGLVALGAALVLMMLGSWRRAALGIAMALGIPVAATLAIPSGDALAVVETASMAVWGLAMALGAGLWAASIGASAVLRWRSRWQVAGGSLVLLLGALFAAVQVGPYLAVRRVIRDIGPLPGPVVNDWVEAQVGATVTREPPLVHRLVETSPPADPARWGLDRPMQVHVTTAGLGTAIVAFRYGPVRLDVPVQTKGIEDRGPAAWPLAVGDTVQLGPEPGGPVTLSIRVVRSEPRNGLLAFITEIEEGESRRTIVLARGDGALHQVGDDDADGNASLTPWFVEAGDGTCSFDGLPCACAPAWSACRWTPSPTPVLDDVVRPLLRTVTLGLVDVGGPPGPQQLVVLSRSGSLLQVL